MITTEDIDRVRTIIEDKTDIDGKKYTLYKYEYRYLHNDKELYCGIGSLTPLNIDIVKSQFAKSLNERII